jgi:SHS2 domain-containing protein
MVARPRFEIIEHTADAGIVARGATLADAFAAAAEGMYALMVDVGAVRETEARDVTAAGADACRLLEHWLLELLFLTETERLVFRRFEVDIAQDGASLRARAFGERLDPERHAVSAAVKGVTRHLTEVTPEDGGVRVRVLFDL